MGNWSYLTFKEKLQLIFTPILFVMGMGIGLGVWARRPYAQIELNALYWSGEIAVCVLIYLAVILLSVKVFKMRFDIHLRKRWQLMMIGLLIMYLINLAQPLLTIHLLSDDPANSYQHSSMFMTLPISVAAIFLLIQMLVTLLVSEMVMQTTGFWRIFERLLSGDPSNKKENGIQRVPESARELKIGDPPNDIHISSEDISHITVENHFSTITYKDNQDNWHQWGIYTSLNDFEDKLPKLLRVNRSTLINPKYISEITKHGRQLQISLKPSPEEQIIVSRSKVNLLKDFQ